MLRICNVSRDALNACHSAQGCARVCTESWLRKKSLATPGNWTCISSAPYSWHSTNLTTSHSLPFPSFFLFTFSTFPPCPPPPPPPVYFICNHPLRIQLYWLCVEKFAFWLIIYIKTFNKINNKTSTTRWNTELKTTQIQGKYLTMYTCTHARTLPPTHQLTHTPKHTHTHTHYSSG